MNLAQKSLRKFALYVMRQAGVVPTYPIEDLDRPAAIDVFADDYPRAFRLVPDIYAAVSLIQSAIAELPLRFYTGDADDRMEMLPEPGNVAHLWQTANEQDTGYELIEQLTGGIEIGGNSYLYMDVAGLTPIRLWVLPSHHVNPVPSGRQEVAAYEYRLPGSWEPVLIPADQIVHFKNYNPDHGVKGLSTLGVARMTYETQWNSKRMLDTFYKHGGKVAGDYSTDQALGPQDIERVRKQLHSQRGPEQITDAVVLPRGLTRVRAGLTQQEMQFIETANLTTSDILRIFKIPPVIMGVKEGGGLSDAGASADMVLFWQNCIMPRCRRIQATLNERFLTVSRFGMSDLTCEFDYSNVLAVQAVFLQQAKSYFAATGGYILTRDEARKRLGLPELDTGQEEVEKLLEPLSVATVEDPTDSTSEPSDLPFLEEPEDDAEVDDDEAADDDAAEEGDDEEADDSPLFGSSRAREKLRRRNERKLMQEERGFEAGIKRLYKQQRERVIEALRESELAERGMLNGDGVRQLDKLESLLKQKEPDRLLLARLVRRIVQNRGIDAVLEVAKDAAFDINNQRVVEFIMQKAVEVLRNVNATTAKALRTTLMEGVATGETTAELTARVSEVFVDRTLAAKVVSRTEVVAAFNYASDEGYRQSGVVHMKEWLTANDDAVRESHREAEGQKVALGQTFSVGAGRLRFPGDPSGPAEEVINCRCTIMPVVQGRSRKRKKQKPQSLDEVFGCVPN